MSDGAPLDHECFRLPPAALKAEMAGDYDRANEILHASKLVRMGAARKHNCGSCRKSNPAEASGVPKESIRWLVGNMSVGETDQTVRENIEARMRKANAPERLVKAAGKFAVECHHKNQKLYTQVMSGRFR